MPAPLPPLRRRILCAVLFEGLGIVLSTLLLMAISGADAAASGSLSALAAGIALAWNLAFNAAFEAWEHRQPRKGRPLALRIAHAALFEAGLTAILVPIVAWWLGVTLWQALVYDLAIVVFFGVYALVFTWAFDRVFGLPASAR
jgi:uncharacterized membrane protein